MRSSWPKHTDFMKITSNNLPPKSQQKHYMLESFIRLANLLPWTVQQGARGIELDHRFVPENDLLRVEEIRNLPKSQLGLKLLEDRRKAIARMRKLNAAEKKRALNSIDRSMPSAAQLRLIETLHTRFMQGFPEGRVEMGPQSFLLSGNRFLLYSVYAAVVEALSGIAEGGIKVGREHVAAFSIPLSVQQISIVWDDEDKPAIEFVSNILLDGFREALTGADPRRIKVCPICGRFFWAQRLDKSACSPPCLNTARVRRHRAKSQQYELARKLKT